MIVCGLAYDRIMVDPNDPNVNFLILKPDDVVPAGFEDLGIRSVRIKAQGQIIETMERHAVRIGHEKPRP